MNLRSFGLALLILNVCFVPGVFAEKEHQHHYHNHHLSHNDKDLLMYGTREKLAEGYSQKCDENHELRKANEDLKKGLIPHRNEIIMYSMAAGAACTVGMYAAIKIWCNC